MVSLEEEVRTVLEKFDLNQQEEDLPALSDAGNLSEKQSHYYEPSNFKLVTRTPSNKNDRKVTIIEPTNSGYDGRRRGCYSTFVAGIHQFDPYQELTATQIAAFRQVFDIVDKDGGGSIDAAELYNSMKDIESGLKLDEIQEILNELDRDGNGEIDFEEFLYMMTSMSSQISKDGDGENNGVKPSKRRQSIFFSVITRFAMKHSIKEIERYYASKAHYTPHVVGHYAAGARVFGLSEKELFQTWKDLALASKALASNSPYAQPLNFCISANQGQGFKKKTIRVKRRRHSSTTSTSSPSKSPLCKSPPARPISRMSSTRSRSPNGLKSSSRPESKAGWTPRHRLPIAKVGLPFIQHGRKKNLTISDMDGIRDKVNKARDAYYERLNQENEEKTISYWKSLKIDEIPSERLQKNFTRVFRAYSPTGDVESDLPISPRRKTRRPKWQTNFDTKFEMPSQLV